MPALLAVGDAFWWTLRWFPASPACTLHCLHTYRSSVVCMWTPQVPEPTCRSTRPRPVPLCCDLAHTIAAPREGQPRSSACQLQCPLSCCQSSAVTCAPHHVARRRYGRGTKPDWQRAGEVYAKATLGQAFFNLGYMHQYGAGLPQVGLPKTLKPAGPKLRALVAHWGRHVLELLCATPKYETKRAGGWRCPACGAVTELAGRSSCGTTAGSQAAAEEAEVSAGSRPWIAAADPMTLNTLDCLARWCCDKAAAAVACCGRKVEFCRLDRRIETHLKRA